MGTKLKPGKFDCHAAALDNEPMFTLLARDPLAPIVVSLWAALYRMQTTDRTKAHDKANEALTCALAMEVWKLENPEV